MEKSENEPTSVEGSDGVASNHWPWLHLSSQLLCYILSQVANFPSFVTAIHDKVNNQTQYFKIITMNNFNIYT